MVPDGIAPNIGYIAQAYRVTNLDSSEQEIINLKCSIYTKRRLADIPGLGKTDMLMIKNPGSGALQLIFQAIN
jgi:hypothetical protein